jgi:hypothetical protein
MSEAITLTSYRNRALTTETRLFLRLAQIGKALAILFPEAGCIPFRVRSCFARGRLRDQNSNRDGFSDRVFGSVAGPGHLVDAAWMGHHGVIRWPHAPHPRPRARRLRAVRGRRGRPDRRPPGQPQRAPARLNKNHWQPLVLRLTHNRKMGKFYTVIPAKAGIHIL